MNRNECLHPDSSTQVSTDSNSDSRSELEIGNAARACWRCCNFHSFFLSRSLACIRFHSFSATLEATSPRHTQRSGNLMLRVCVGRSVISHIPRDRVEIRNGPEIESPLMPCADSSENTWPFAAHTVMWALLEPNVQSHSASRISPLSGNSKCSGHRTQNHFLQ